QENAHAWLVSSSAYNSNRDLLVIFGGGNEIDGYRADNWCFALPLHGPAAWDTLSPGEDPSGIGLLFPAPRLMASATYDAARDRLIIVGGRGGGWGVVHLQEDALALDLASREWSDLSAETGSHPGWPCPVGL